MSHISLQQWRSKTRGLPAGWDLQPCAELKSWEAPPGSPGAQPAAGMSPSRGFVVPALTPCRAFARQDGRDCQAQGAWPRIPCGGFCGIPWSWFAGLGAALGPVIFWRSKEYWNHPFACSSLRNSWLCRARPALVGADPSWPGGELGDNKCSCLREGNGSWGKEGLGKGKGSLGNGAMWGAGNEGVRTWRAGAGRGLLWFPSNRIC